MKTPAGKGEVEMRARKVTCMLLLLLPPIALVVLFSVWSSRAFMGSAPLGSVVAWPSELRDLPDGWWPCDGSAVPTDCDADLAGRLAQIYGTDGATGRALLPDYRGQFLRGCDERPDMAAARNRVLPAGGPGRTVGTIQAAATAQPKASAELLARMGRGQMSHYFGTRMGAVSFLALPANPSAWDEMPGNLMACAGEMGGAGPEKPRQLPELSWDDETRPRNVFVYWIMRVRD